MQLSSTYMIKKILISILFTTSTFSMPKGLRLATQDWPPYQYVSNDQVVGQAVNAVKCVTDRMNIKTRVDIYPWMRAQMYTEKGSVDGFFAASHSDRRDSFAVQSLPFIKQNWYFYSLKSNHLPKNISEIKKRFVVYARLNSNVYNWLLVNGFKVKSSYTETNKNITLLLKNRISVYMENSTVLEHELKKLNIEESLLNKTFNRSHHLGVCFGKKFISKHPKFLNKFNSIAQKNCSNI